MCLNWNHFTPSRLLSLDVKLAILHPRKPKISMTNPLVEKGSATNSECQLPVGISMPKPLSIAGSLATNCKKYVILGKLCHCSKTPLRELFSNGGIPLSDWWRHASLMMEWISTSSKTDKILKLSLPSLKKFASERQMRHESCVFNNQVQEPYSLLKSPSCSWNDQVWPVT